LKDVIKLISNRISVEILGNNFKTTILKIENSLFAGTLYFLFLLCLFATG